MLEEVLGRLLSGAIWGTGAALIGGLIRDGSPLRQMLSRTWRRQRLAPPNDLRQVHVTDPSEEDSPANGSLRPAFAERGHGTQPGSGSTTDHELPDRTSPAGELAQACQAFGVRELSRASNLSLGTVSKIKRGLGNPDQDTVAKLKMALLRLNAEAQATA